MAAQHSEIREEPIRKKRNFTKYTFKVPVYEVCFLRSLRADEDQRIVILKSISGGTGLGVTYMCRGLGVSLTSTLRA